MAKTELRLKAQELRKKGLTFSEIKNVLGPIPQSTLSHWCKETKLPSYYYRKLKKINVISRIKGRQAFQKLREEELKIFYKEAKNNNNNLISKFNDNDIKKIALSILYLGEGSRWRSHKGLMLGSSDPNIIKLYIKLLKDVYDIQNSSLRVRISYRADQDINELTKFWSKIAKIKENQFYKTKYDPRTVGKITKNKDYKGVCVVSCGNSKIQLELEIIAKMICEGR